MVGRDDKGSDHPKLVVEGEKDSIARSGPSLDSPLVDTKKDKHLKLDAESLYMREIRLAPLLTASQERELAKTAQQGDPKALEKMIVSNLRLVVKIARRYHSPAMSLLDIVEEGNIGLMSAVTKFDPDKGYRFSTYASWWIRHEIERAILNKGRTVRLPIHISREVNKYYRLSIELMKTLQHEPSLGEESELSGLSIDEISKLKRLQRRTKSMDAAFSGSPLGLLDAVKNPQSEDPVAEAQAHEVTEHVLSWLKFLDHQQREVIERRYGLSSSGQSVDEPQTLNEVAKAIGLTRESVRKIQLRALAKLKSILEKNGVFWDDVSDLE